MEHKSVNKFDILEKIAPLIENTAMRYNLIPIEIDFSKESGKWFLRIFLYSYERGVTLDDCERVSRSLSDFLDELIPVKYYLEVSSPGLDRKIKSDKEYVIFNGKTINLKLKKPLEGTEIKQLLAKIKDFNENDGLTVEKCDDNEIIVVPVNNIARAQLEIE
jgi:ribosome maturation factor RimP